MADIVDPFETKSSSNIKDPFEKSVPTTEPIDTSTRTERNLGRAGAFATGWRATRGRRYPLAQTHAVCRQPRTVNCPGCRHK